jgi:hypothetical protein
MYQIIRNFCFLGLLLGTCFTAQSFDKTYLCVKDTLVGISGENDVWTASKFTTTEDKFIIRPLKEGDYFYGVNENTHGAFFLGVEEPEMPCRFDKFTNKTLVCYSGFDNKLRFREDTLRFVETSTLGYYHPLTKEDGQVSISIGKCTSF